MTPTERLKEIGKEIGNLPFNDENVFKLERYYNEAIKICLDNDFNHTAVQVGASKSSTIDLMYKQKTIKQKKHVFERGIYELNADLVRIL